MLKKECLFGIASDAPEPGYVKAELTIGTLGVVAGSFMGYRRGVRGALTPDVVHGKNINELNSGLTENGIMIQATVPFYYNGKKYQNGEEDANNALFNEWTYLLNQTVEVWLGGVNALVLQVIAALLGGLHDACEGTSASGGRNFGNSRLHSGNEKLTQDFVRSYGIYKYRGSSRKFWNENPVFSFFRNSLYVLAGIKRFTVQRACSQLHGDGEIHHGDYERFQASTRFGCNWRVVQFWGNESYPRRRGNQNSHSAVAVNAASVKEVA